jgi:hypothetical protein
MAASNSIRRALLRPGHFLKLSSDRRLYVSPVLSLGGFSVYQSGSTHTLRNGRQDTNPTHTTHGG